jgi:ABC-type branched-subunit amino acid transport system ATPase component
MVVSYNGKELHDSALSLNDAQKVRADIEEMIPLDGSDQTLEEREGKWVVLSQDRSRVLGTFGYREKATRYLHDLSEIGTARKQNGFLAFVSLLLGLFLGSAGAWSVWRRARRTPDVIALGGIARTFQNIRLFQEMTVLENVLVAMNRSFRVDPLRLMLKTPAARKEERHAVARALETLQFVGLESEAYLLAKNLPYGHQRRLEIARALATEPRLMLLDEPAAGMNPTETAELMELIQRIRGRGMTVLLIEHHMKLVMGISDRIAVLDHGVKIAEGTPEEIRKNQKVIDAYLGKEEVG